jgi:hypothetical protein
MYTQSETLIITNEQSLCIAWTKKKNMQYINLKLEQWKILCLWVFGHLWLFKSGLYCDRKKKNKTMKLQVTFGNKVLVISERHRLRILIVFVVWSNTLLYLFTQRMRNFVARIACFKINRQLLTFPKNHQNRYES